MPQLINLKEIKMYIFGASGHGKVVASILKATNIQIQGFLDDAPQTETLLNIPVIPTKSFTPTGKESIVIGVGDNLGRKKCAARLKAVFKTVVHPSAVICETVKINEGTVVMPQAVINSDAVIGKHCIINTGAIVEHDCVIEDFVHISPKAAIAGGVRVGEGTHIGIGASVIPGVTIGKWAVIGAGAVVTKNVPDGSLTVGVPAHIIKTKKIPT